MSLLLTGGQNLYRYTGGSGFVLEESLPAIDGGITGLSVRADGFLCFVEVAVVDSRFVSTLWFRPPGGIWATLALTSINDNFVSSTATGIAVNDTTIYISSSVGEAIDFHTHRRIYSYDIATEVISNINPLIPAGGIPQSLEIHPVTGVLYALGQIATAKILKYENDVWQEVLGSIDNRYYSLAFNNEGQYVCMDTTGTDRDLVYYDEDSNDWVHIINVSGDYNRALCLDTGDSDSLFPSNYNDRIYPYELDRGKIYSFNKEFKYFPSETVNVSSGLTGLEVTEDKIYGVTFSGGVRVYERDGTSLSDEGFDIPEDESYSAIAVTENRIYVLITTQPPNIVVYDKQGNRQLSEEVFNLTDFNYNALTVKDNILYLSELRSVESYDLQGNFLETWEALEIPHGISKGRDRFYILAGAENHVKGYDFDGVVVPGEIIDLNFLGGGQWHALGLDEPQIYGDITVSIETPLPTVFTQVQAYTATYPNIAISSQTPLPILNTIVSTYEAVYPNIDLSSQTPLPTLNTAVSTYDIVYPNIDLSSQTPLPTLNTAVSTYDIVYHDIALSSETPLPTIATQVSSVAPLLQLSDFDSDDIDLDFLALIEVSGDPVLYADLNRGGTDRVVEGELGIGTGETLITRVQWNGTLLIFNDNDVPAALSLATYFNSGGSGANQTVYLQAADAVVSFSVASYIDNAGGGYVRFGNLPSAVTNLLDGLSVGDRLIVGSGIIYNDIAIEFETPLPTFSPSADTYEAVYPNIAVSIETPLPTVSTQVDIYTVLQLSDFDSDGIDLDFLALIEVSGDLNLYADSNRGGSDSPIEGELGLGIDDTLVTRIRWEDPVLIFNDNDAALSLATYFNSGAGSNQTIYLQTADAIVSFPVSSNVDSAGGNFVRFSGFLTAVTNLLDGLSVGDRLIVGSGIIYNDITIDIETPLPTAQPAVHSYESTIFIDIDLSAQTPLPTFSPSAATYEAVYPNIDLSPETPLPTTEVQVSIHTTYRSIVVSSETPLPTFTPSAENYPVPISYNYILPYASSLEWAGAVLIDPKFVEGGGVAYLRYIRVIGGSIQLRTSLTAGADPDDAGPELTPLWETYEEAITLTDSLGNSIVLKGPNHPDNSFAEGTEPYFWTPDNSSEVIAWALIADGTGDSITVRLNDGVETGAYADIEVSLETPPPTLNIIVDAINVVVIDIAVSSQTPLPTFNPRPSQLTYPNIAINIETPLPTFSLLASSYDTVYPNIAIDIQTPLPTYDPVAFAHDTVHHDIPIDIETPLPTFNAILFTYDIVQPNIDVSAETPLPTFTPSIHKVGGRYVWTASRQISGAPTAGDAVAGVWGTPIRIDIPDSQIIIPPDSITALEIAPLTITADEIAPLAITGDQIAPLAITADEIAEHTITADEIAPLAITADEIANDTITADEIANDTITADEIANDTITADEIANDTITADEIAPLTITADEIRNLAVNSTKIAAGAVITGKIADGVVTVTKIADGAVITGKIADGVVTATKIADGAVITSKISNDAITVTQIADGSIITSKIDGNAVTATKIGSGAITTSKIADNNITSTKIADGNITTSKIDNNAVTATKIGSGAVTTSKIADGDVTVTKIANGAITTSKIVDGNITSIKIADGAITTSKIVDGNITVTKIADGGITTAKITDEAVTGVKIADGAITTSKIADGVTITASIADGSITTAKISDEAVTAAKIGSGAITTSKIANGDVTVTKIANGAITTGKISDEAVTSIKIADGAITTSKIADGVTITASIADGSITTAKIADNAITAAKIGSGAVTTSKIVDGNITVTKIADGAITTGKIAGSAVTATEIANGAVTTSKIDDDAVTVTQIADGSITTGKIVNSNVTATKIGNGAVTTSKIGSDAVTVTKIADGSITTGKIVGAAVTATKIGAGAVTTSKIGSNSVTSTKIANGAVTTGKIAGDSVTATEIADGSIITTKVSPNNITSALVADGAITTTKIGSNAATSTKIADGSITTTKIANGATTAVKIADGSITTTKIADGTVSTVKIGDGAITVSKIGNGNVTAIKLAPGAVDLGSTAVVGTLTADHIDADVLNVRPIWSGTITRTTPNNGANTTYQTVSPSNTNYSADYIMAICSISTGNRKYIVMFPRSTVQSRTTLVVDTTRALDIDWVAGGSYVAINDTREHIELGADDIGTLTVHALWAVFEP